MTHSLLENGSACGPFLGAVCQGALVILGLVMAACLVRAVRGPSLADRVVAINMMGTAVVLMICLLTLLMKEDYLVDVAMIYTMLSFLAVIVLTRIYLGVWKERHARERKAVSAGDGEEGTHG